MKRFLTGAPIPCWMHAWFSVAIILYCVQCTVSAEFRLQIALSAQCNRVMPDSLAGFTTIMTHFFRVMVLRIQRHTDHESTVLPTTSPICHIDSAKLALLLTHTQPQPDHWCFEDLASTLLRRVVSADGNSSGPDELV